MTSIYVCKYIDTIIYQQKNHLKKSEAKTWGVFFVVFVQFVDVQKTRGPQLHTPAGHFSHSVWNMAFSVCHDASEARRREILSEGLLRKFVFRDKLGVSTS